MSEFDPNQVTFAQGAVRVEGVVAKHRLDVKDRVLTSKDAGMAGVLKDLDVTSVPPGFTKVQLPFVFDGGQFFITHAKPHAEVPTHSHDNGDALRFIVDGSVIHEGVELHAGDWMFVPKGVAYTMQIGAKGATMCYCYECCCARRFDLRAWLVDPAP